MIVEIGSATLIVSTTYPRVGEGMWKTLSAIAGLLRLGKQAQFDAHHID